MIPGIQNRTLAGAERLATTLVALCLLAPAARSNDGDIKFTFDPNTCAASIPCGQTRTMYLHLVLDGATAAGITGVEYSVRIGMDGDADPGWTFGETWATDATVTLGMGAFYPADLIRIQPRFTRGRGVNVAWNACQTGSDGKVLLETIEVTNTGCAEGELRLLAWSHDTPRNRAFQCPLAVLCDGPVFTKVCLGANVEPCTNPDGPNGPPAQCSTSGEAVLNPVARSQSPCAVTAVTPVSWGSMKSLYRN